MGNKVNKILKSEAQKYFIGLELYFSTFCICSYSQRCFDVGQRFKTRHRK